MAPARQAGNRFLGSSKRFTNTGSGQECIREYCTAKILKMRLGYRSSSHLFYVIWRCSHLAQSTVQFIYKMSPCSLRARTVGGSQARWEVQSTRSRICQMWIFYTVYILLGAHKLRARRTVCKSVFFQRYKLLTNKSRPIPA